MKIAVLRETMREAEDVARPLRAEGHEVVCFSWTCPNVGRARGHRFDRLDWIHSRLWSKTKSRHKMLDALTAQSAERVCHG